MTEQAVERQELAYTYEDLDALGAEAAAAVALLWLARPHLDFDEWVGLVVRALVNFILRGESIGLALGGALPAVDAALIPTGETRRRPAPDSFRPYTDGYSLSPGWRVDPVDLEKRLRIAVETLAGQIPPDAQAGPVLRPVERLASDEPIRAAQAGLQQGRVDAGGSGGYRRGVNPDCCELCFWLWKEGYVYPITHPMHRHIGCRCIPVPTTDAVGRHELSPDDRGLLETLYDNYIRNEKGTGNE